MDQLPAIAVGLAFDPSKANGCAAIIDLERKSVGARVFKCNPIFKIESCMEDPTVWPEELQEIREFLAEAASDRLTQVTVASPSAIVPRYSQVFTSLGLILSSGVVAPVFSRASQDSDISGDAVLIGSDIPRVVYASEYPNRRGVRLHWECCCQAYAKFCFERDTIERVAFAAAFMGHTDGLHYFFRSQGQVQSSGDIVALFGRKAMFSQMGLPESVKASDAVVSESESFAMELMPSFQREDESSLPRIHALAVKRHQHLGFFAALKFALLEVSRRWGIELKCNSLRSESTAAKIVESLRSQEPSEDHEFSKIIKQLVEQTEIKPGHEARFLASVIERIESAGGDRSRIAMELFSFTRQDTETDGSTVYNGSAGYGGWLAAAIEEGFPSGQAT